MLLKKMDMMNNSPQFSIIVPVYNTEKYLRKCIDSIIAQTNKDWELLLVDDGIIGHKFILDFIEASRIIS